MGAWHIRISGKRRQHVDPNLIVQAIIALGEQLQREEQQRQAAAALDTDTTTDMQEPTS
jgi:hypothetical protein